jgi:hypothetical protein
MGADRYAGFGLGDGAVDELNGAAAMAAFVVLSSLERGTGGAQMLERGAHVGLIRPNRLKTDRCDHRHQNQTCA